jgi:atypical dual specificity phosphatase
VRILARLVFVLTLLWNVLVARWLGWCRWWDVVDEYVWLGAVPLEGDVPRLREAGVRAVINLCEECHGPERAYDKFGITQLRIPLADYSSPSLSNVQQCLSFIEKHASRREIVYLHCKAGRGRSATVALCWLMASQGLPPERAEALLLAKRPQVLRNLSRRRVVQELWQQQQQRF